MKTRGLILLLLSGWVLVVHPQTDDVVRRFYAVRDQKTRNEARRYCWEKFDELAIIRDKTDNHNAMQTLTEGKFWIGLFYGTAWRWTDHSEVGFHNWDKVKQVPADSDKHILVKKPMSWFGALDYCMSRYTSLSSISSLEDNTRVAVLLQTDPVSSRQSGEDEDPSDAWIGLYRNKWIWPGSIVPKYKRWGPEQPGENTKYAVMDSSGDWSSTDHQDTNFFLCHKDFRPSVLRMVKVRLRAGSADLSDPALQDTVLQQLKQTLADGGIREDVKLRWTRQPDGKIFHREEEERAPPGDGEEEDDGDRLIWTP